MPITTGNTPKALGGKMANWMAGAVKHPGALHRALGVPEGKDIPGAKMKQAEHPKSGKIRKMAGLAKAFAGANHNDGGCAYHGGGRMAYPCSER